MGIRAYAVTGQQQSPVLLIVACKLLKSLNGEEFLAQMIMTKDGVHRRGRQPGGFTTLEVVIVIAIIMALAAVAVPNLSDWASNQRLKSATRDLFTHLQYARLEAVKRSTTIAVNFNYGGVGDDNYTVFVDNGAGGGIAGNLIRDNSSELILKRVIIPMDVNLDNTSFVQNGAGADAFGYNARGFPVDASFTDEEGVVTVSNNKRIYTVKLQRTSGALSLEGPAYKSKK